MSEWHPSIQTEAKLRELADTMLREMAYLLHIDEIIPSCEVIDMDPYTVGAYPRYIKTRIHEYYQDVYCPIAVTFGVADLISVIHFREGDRYEVLAGAGGGGGTAIVPVTKRWPIPMEPIDGDLAYVDVYKGAETIDFWADGDQKWVSLPMPNDWDQASDMYVKALVCSESNETAGQDIIFRLQVNSYIEGDTIVDNGQTPQLVKVITAPDAVTADEIYLCSATLDYDHGVYPLQPGGCIVIECEIDMSGEDSITNGPVHIISWWLEYTADRLGE